MFKNKNNNELLGIGIPEVLMYIILCHGFAKITNSTVILVCRSSLVNYYLSKWFVIIEHNSKHSSSVPNEMKQRIHVINMQKQTF